VRGRVRRPPFYICKRDSDIRWGSFAAPPDNDSDPRHNNQISVVIEAGASLIHALRPACPVDWVSDLELGC